MGCSFVSYCKSSHRGKFCVIQFVGVMELLTKIEYFCFYCLLGLEKNVKVRGYVEEVQNIEQLNVEELEKNKLFSLL